MCRFLTRMCRFFVSWVVLCVPEEKCENFFHIVLQQRWIDRINQQYQVSMSCSTNQFRHFLQNNSNNSTNKARPTSVLSRIFDAWHWGYGASELATYPRGEILKINIWGLQAPSAKICWGLKAPSARSKRKKEGSAIKLRKDPGLLAPPKGGSFSPTCKGGLSAPRGEKGLKAPSGRSKNKTEGSAFKLQKDPGLLAPSGGGVF